MKSVNQFKLGFIFLFIFSNFYAQEIEYFPKKNEKWKEKTPSEFNIHSDKLLQAVQFAKENEYSESRDLRVAILNGFKSEPFHEILGPTKKRGGPAGLILKNGYLCG